MSKLYNWNGRFLFCCKKLFVHKKMFVIAKQFLVSFFWFSCFCFCRSSCTHWWALKCTQWQHNNGNNSCTKNKAMFSNCKSSVCTTETNEKISRLASKVSSCTQNKNAQKWMQIKNKMTRNNNNKNKVIFACHKWQKCILIEPCHVV